MQRQASIAYGGFLVGVWTVLSLTLLVKGALFIAKHEGDTMHLIDMVIRQSQGEWAHLDYMTPIGFLATAPIALFVSLGWGVGISFLAAQVLVAGLLLPAIWWVGASRLSTGWAFVFGAICFGLAMAMVHGEAQPSVSISMHYNRWAWVLAFLAITVSILPTAARRSQTADGVVIGFAISGMALIKVTYVAAFLPGILLALLLRKQWRAIVVALLAGLSVIAIVTLAAGIGFWGAYIADLLTVTGSEARPRPGHSLHGVIASPAYLGGSFAALVSVVLLRQAGRDIEGLILLVLLPGFFFVTYQNYGNDPQWLYLLGVLLFALRPAAGVTNGAGWDMRQALALAGCAVFMLGLPSALNLAFSPFRHYFVNAAEYAPMFPRSGPHVDILAKAERNAHPAGNITLPIVGFDRDPDEAGIGPTTVLGEALPACRLSGGTVTVFDGIARELEATGFGNIAPLTADMLGSFWLLGDFQRLPGGAPWRYDGLPGIEAASHFLVPLCPVDNTARRDIILEMEASDYGLSEVSRNDVYILFEIQEP